MLAIGVLIIACGPSKPKSGDDEEKTSETASAEAPAAITLTKAPVSPEFAEAGLTLENLAGPYTLQNLRAGSCRFNRLLLGAQIKGA